MWGIEIHIHPIEQRCERPCLKVRKPERIGDEIVALKCSVVENLHLFQLPRFAVRYLGFGF